MPGSRTIPFIAILFGLLGSSCFCQAPEIQPISAALERELQTSGVFSPQSPVSAQRLRLLKLRYWDFEQNAQEGELIVLDAVSRQVLQIFEALYQRKFPIARMRLLSAYRGSDSLSMADNNTSAHNFRQVTGGGKLSLHAYGTAIDLNPVQNPYFRIDTLKGLVFVQPLKGAKHINRRIERLGKPRSEGLAEEVIEVFAQNGFYRWGGDWDTPIDYQHFEVQRPLTELLVLMDGKQASAFFEKVVAYYNQKRKPLEIDLISAMRAQNRQESIVEFYRKDPQAFWRLLDSMK
jgi:D-alanyl-D-alanine carboxypeptidase